jgi:hypothetical protein
MNQRNQKFVSQTLTVDIPLSQFRMAFVGGN